jgi:hypothetical protein
VTFRNFRPNGRTGGLRLALVAVLTGLACGQLVDPPLPDNAVLFVPPPVYAQWWAMVEECSGLQGSLDAVQWYAAPGELLNPKKPNEVIAGYWSEAGNRIVLTSNDTIEGDVVRHEMLHALARTPGHPRSAFLQNCGGVVACAEECLRDAGAPAPPDPAAPRVAPDQVEVTGAVSVISPSSAEQPAFATFTISAHNPFPYPVVVVLPLRAGESIPTTYTYRIVRLNSGGGLGSGDVALDIGGTYFAAGETKRDVFDVAIALIAAPTIGAIAGVGSEGISLPPATYSFGGSFGGHPAPDVTLILNQ